MLSRKGIDFPVTIVVAALALLLSIGLWEGAAFVELLTFDRTAVASGQLWRIWTGPLLHIDYGQAGRDLAVFVLLGAVFEGEFKKRWPVLLALLIPVSPLLMLVGHPELDLYFGLSGAVNGLFAIALVYQWRTAEGSRWWATTVAIGFVLKLLYEVISGGMLLPMPLAHGAQPLPLAHLGGAIVGLLLLRLAPAMPAVQRGFKDHIGQQ